jgi:glycogen synthase
MAPDLARAASSTRPRQISRVLMTADAVGGVWSYAVQLAAWLSTSRGVRTMLAVMGPSPSAAQLEEAGSVPNLTVRSRPYMLEWMPEAWMDVDAAGEWLLSLSRTFNPDIVHLNGYCHADLAWSAPTLVVAHSCVCSWWDAVEGGPPPGEWSDYIDRVRSGLQSASAVVAPSAAMARALESFYGRPGARMIGNGRSQDAWRPADKEEIVFAAGRAWDRGKNLAILDCVAATLPWPVYLAGDTTGPGSPPAGLSHIRSLGQISSGEVAHWMGRAAIYAFPARYEPFGLSVLEAALSGCALVLGDIPSLRENWYGVARFVVPDDAEQLGTVVRELIDRPRVREAMGRAARARAELFTPERQVDAYYSLYVDMVTSRDRVAHPSRSY